MHHCSDAQNVRRYSDLTLTFSWYCHSHDHSFVVNCERHVTAFEPITEARRSWT